MPGLHLITKTRRARDGKPLHSPTMTKAVADWACFTSSSSLRSLVFGSLSLTDAPGTDSSSNRAQELLTAWLTSTGTAAGRQGSYLAQLGGNHAHHVALAVHLHATGVTRLHSDADLKITRIVLDAREAADLAFDELWFRALYCPR